jgi:hypothetical protein
MVNNKQLIILYNWFNREKQCNTPPQLWKAKIENKKRKNKQNKDYILYFIIILLYYIFVLYINLLTF